ncbi:MAG: alpha/beta fold hydrolase, partial [Jiangellaceae bacterium]
MEVVRAKGLEIAYERVGEGPPLVFVHGAASDARLWRPQLAALADEFTVVAWDEPGAGSLAGLLDGEHHARPRTNAGTSVLKPETLAMDTNRSLRPGFSFRRNRQCPGGSTRGSPLHRQASTAAERRPAHRSADSGGCRNADVSPAVGRRDRFQGSYVALGSILGIVAADEV